MSTPATNSPAQRRAAHSAFSKFSHAWRALAPSQLQALLLRPDHLAHRHMDDPPGDQLAGLSPHAFRAAARRRRLLRPVPCLPSGTLRGRLGRAPDRRKLLVWTQAARRRSISRPGRADSGSRHHLWEIIALAALQGLINAFDMPGRQSFLVQMVEDRNDLSNAIAINSSMANGARLIGPAIAGLVIASFRRRLVLSARRPQLFRRHRVPSGDAHPPQADPPSQPPACSNRCAKAGITSATFVRSHTYFRFSRSSA